MQKTLHLKFIAIYIIFGFLSFFITGLMTHQLMLQYLVQQETKNIYKYAASATTEYLPEYFTHNISTSELHIQLNGMKTSLNADVWLVRPDGSRIASSTLNKKPAPNVIEGFDPAESGSSKYIISDYHGYFNEDVVTIIAPVTSGFSTRGYLLIHKPIAQVEYFCKRIMIPVYLTITIILLLSLVVFLGLRFLVFKPLETITDAAKKYASGDLDYEIPIHTHDEFGYLSASLNYMSSQLKDMEDYQKKIVANVSHDFRSPLTSIKGYVEAMADGIIPPELYEKYLRIISFETERLTDLSNDLLTLNQFDTNAVMLDKSAFDIQAMIKQTAESFEGKCKEKQLSINLIMLPDPAYVYADKRKIQQVIYNLMDNAIKFTPPELSITVEVSDKNEKYGISIKDLGEGIPQKELNKIWERFYKSDASRGKDKKGTGLGLAIVKEALTAHDEYINVISTEGVGTEFIFQLSKADKSLIES